MNSLKTRSAYSLSTDCVVFGYDQDYLQVALIQRKNAPFQHKWALPGGFVEGDETVEEAAFRELQEETGIAHVHLEQVKVFSDPDRDPRGRVITVAFFALVDASRHSLFAQEDAERALWWPAYALPPLAFDHELIFQEALHRLRDKVEKEPIAFTLLPREFTLTQLQTLYEQIFGAQMDKRNFRKKVGAAPYIRATGKMTGGTPHRPAQLYRFDRRKFPKHEKGLDSFLS